MHWDVPIELSAQERKVAQTVTSHWEISHSIGFSGWQRGLIC